MIVIPTSCSVTQFSTAMGCAALNPAVGLWGDLAAPDPLYDCHGLTGGWLRN